MYDMSYTAESKLVNLLAMQPPSKVRIRRRAADAYRSFAEDSFYRNSTYLLINMVIATGTGFLFVVICAHLFSQADFGYATSLMGALGVATALSNIGMNRTLVRFMGKSNEKSQDLVTGILMVSGFSMLFGIVLSLFLPSFGIKHAGLFVVIIFVVTVFLMSIKSLFDNVFIAIRESSGMLIENSISNAARLLFPIFVVGSGYIGIFSAQLASVILALGASVILLKRYHGFAFLIKPSKASMHGKWRFALGSYTSDLTGGLPSSVLPIIVVARLGPVAGALWYVAMQITNVLLSVSASINQAMFAEMANADGSINHFLKKASLSMYGVLIPLSAGVFVLAPYILRVFHGNYIAAEHVLRLMTVFALIGVANFITGSILQVYKMVIYITLVNVANAAVVILYCLFFARNLDGMAIGWVLGEVVNFVLFVGGGLVVARRNHGNFVIN
jgi:O-antigen/teichoic acid export membrane protein